jgi:hypothetical protein
MTRNLVVCPAGPDRTRTFATSRWGRLPTGMTARFLDRRQRTIHQHRSAGDPVTAERYGWLTLASLWAGLGPLAALGQDPARTLDFAGTLITPPDQQQVVPTVAIPNTDLAATDPRDPFGIWLADLAADAATHAVVAIDNAPLSSAIVADALTRILTAP